MGHWKSFQEVLLELFWFWEELCAPLVKGEDWKWFPYSCDKFICTWTCYKHHVWRATWLKNEDELQSQKVLFYRSFVTYFVGKITLNGSKSQQSAPVEQDSRPPCPPFLWPPLKKLKKIKKPNQAACCDAFEAALASPTESFPAAALCEMSNANKEE